MLNASQSFLLLWKRLVAALSLVAAAALAPAVAVPVNGSGLVGPRAGNGAALANAANALVANLPGLVEGGQHKSTPEASDDQQAKACAPPAWPETAVPLRIAASPCRAPCAPRTSYSARSGLARAPPHA